MSESSPVGKPKGLPKSGGRPAGVPNRKTQVLVDKAEELGVDPFEIMLLFAKGDWETLGYPQEKYIKSITEMGSVEEFHVTPEARLSAAEKACQYLYAKRKAIEHSNDDENPVTFNFTLSDDERLDLINKARGV